MRCPTTEVTDSDTIAPVVRRTARRLSRSATLAVGVGLVAACGNPIENVVPSPDAPDLRRIRGGGGSVAPADTYYVSPSGNDRNAGTSTSQPWRTISKVNGMTFTAGTTIAFQGGAVFAGSLSFVASDKGTAADPILITSYGAGRAVIDAGSGSGIKLYNTAGFEITDLIVRGAGRTANSGTGISAYTDLAGGVKLDYLAIDSVEVSGFGKFGIAVGSWNGTTGFKNVRVTNTSSHDNATAGVSAYAQLPGSHQNVYFGFLRSYNNSGHPGTSGPSGSGIVMGGVAGGTIERSVSYNNGWLCTASSGPVGIWAYDSDDVLIQYNESYGNRTSGSSDGGGFDFDQNVRYSSMQYNYSHDNAGPGFLMAHGVANYNHTGNVIRYNITENDARRNSTGAITIWGRTIGTDLYHNTVFVSPSSTGSPRAVYIHNAGLTGHDVKNLHVRNNLVVTTGGVPIVEVSAGQISGAVDLRFEGNNYFAGGGAFKILWSGAAHASLTSWRGASGQETVNGLPVGSSLDPELAGPGAGGTIGDATRLHTLAAYQLTGASPLIDKGLSLGQLYSGLSGLTDFYSLSTPSGSGYDVGAHEWR